MRWLFTILLAAGFCLWAELGSSRTSSPPQRPAVLPAPQGWRAYPSPLADSPALRCANHSRREWRVIPQGDNVKIRIDTRRDHQEKLPPQIASKDVRVGIKGDRHVIRDTDGWLVGVDFGEFGGGLWWFSLDGKKSQKLANDNVVGFAMSSSGILALVGLAHMESDQGRVLRIVSGDAGNRKVELVADLGAAPRTFVAESPTSVLIVTTRAFVRVETIGRVTQLLTTNYARLYPNSMSRSASGIIHVGMRHFITRLTPTGNGYQEEWFVPIGCSKFRIRNYDCVCTPGRA